MKRHNFRTEGITFRVTPREKELIEEMAIAQEVSVSELLRRLMLEEQHYMRSSNES